VPEASYGVIVEGPYDASVYPEFIRKIVTQDVEVVVRPCGGVSRLMARFPGFLREFEFVRQGGPVDKAIVIRDWNTPDLLNCEDELRQKVRNRALAFPRGAQFCCIRQEMESWLLADELAINAVAMQRGGLVVARVDGEIEEIQDPKGRLVGLLSQAKLPYTAAVCGEIARRADIERLKYRCPSFRSFVTKVLDC
jgi:hypothetical protein